MFQCAAKLTTNYAQKARKTVHNLVGFDASELAKARVAYVALVRFALGVDGCKRGMHPVGMFLELFLCIEHIFTAAASIVFRIFDSKQTLCSSFGSNFCFILFVFHILVSGIE